MEDDEDVEETRRRGGGGGEASKSLQTHCNYFHRTHFKHFKHLASFNRVIVELQVAISFIDDKLVVRGKLC